MRVLIAVSTSENHACRSDQARPLHTLLLCSRAPVLAVSLAAGTKYLPKPLRREGFVLARVAGKAWWQEPEVAGYVASSARKQRCMLPGASSALYSVLGPSPLVCPHTQGGASHFSPFNLENPSQTCSEPGFCDNQKESYQHHGHIDIINQPIAYKACLLDMCQYAGIYILASCL